MMPQLIVAIALTIQTPVGPPPPHVPADSMVRPSVWMNARGGVGGPAWDQNNFYHPSHPMHPSNQ